MAAQAPTGGSRRPATPPESPIVTDRLAGAGDDDGRQRRQHRPAVGLGDVRLWAPSRSTSFPPCCSCSPSAWCRPSSRPATRAASSSGSARRSVTAPASRHLVRVHEQRDAVPVAAVLRRRGAGDRVRSTGPGRQRAVHGHGRAGGLLAGHVRGLEGDEDHGRARATSASGLGTIVPAFALIFFMFAWLIDDKPSAAPLQLSDIDPAVRRALQHRPGRRDLRGLRGARGQRGPHQAPQGPTAVLLQGCPAPPPCWSS